MATMSGPIPAAPLASDDALRTVLNRHGYGFQYAALKRALRLQVWRSAVVEYPVELNGASVHVDFVLGFDRHLLVAECKRVEGWRWGFARGHSDARDSAADRPRADFLQWAEDSSEAVLQRCTCSFGKWNHRPYDVSVELKQHENADADTGKTPRAFSDALAQVMRARGGLMQELTSKVPLRYGGGAIVPVIFTTAKLVATETELREADLATGRLGDLQTSTPDYVWFDHNLSAALRPSVPAAPRVDKPPTKTEALQRVLGRDITRSVAVVSAAGIERFLQNLADGLHFSVDAV